MKKWCKAILFSIAFLFFIVSSSVSVWATETLQVQLGAVLDLSETDATYKSSDTNIAYVSKTGRVTGKKLGTAVITIEKDGETIKKNVTVIARGKKTDISVCVDEIVLKKSSVKIELAEEETSVDKEETKKEEVFEDTKEEVEKEETLEDVTEEIEKEEISEDATEETEKEETSQDKAEVEIVNLFKILNSSDTEIKSTTKKNTKEKAQRKYKLSVTLKNESKNTVKKVVLEGKLFGKKVILDFNSMKSEKEKTVTQEGTTNKNTGEFTPIRIRVYSKNMVSIYNYETGNLVYTYATEDTKAPVITGFVGMDSFNMGSQGELFPYQVVYKGEEHDYLKFIKVEDDRDAKKDIQVTVDTSNVNFDKQGVYVITYKATDTAGNVRTATAKLGVRVASNQLDEWASIILEDIIQDDWSDEKKARAIYAYIKSNMRYTGTSDKSDWEKEAKNGLLNGRGDCFTYYAMSRILLTRAGIPNIEIRRVGSAVQRGGNHWWNMVYINNEFYHFDACPRSAGGKFCLVTDDQLKSYTKTHGSSYSHVWDYEKKPKSSTKVISSIF